MKEEVEEEEEGRQTETCGRPLELQSEGQMLSILLLLLLPLLVVEVLQLKCHSRCCIPCCLFPMS